MMSFSGSVQFPVAVTASGVWPPAGATASAQAGGAFFDAATFTLFDAEPFSPPESVAVRFTVNVPAVV